MTKDQDKLTAANMLARMDSPTPPFWKKLRRIGFIIGALGGSILTAAESAGLTLPAWITTSAIILSSVGAAIVAVASMASEYHE